MITPQDKRRILLELRFCYSMDEVCQKWNLTKTTLRQWKKEANFEYLAPTLREMVILALHQGTGDIAGMIAYLDYLDHTIYTAQEIEDILRRLQAEGIAQEEDGRWLYDRTHSHDDTSFIF